MPAIDRPEPPYLQIARRIREDITAGRLAEGDLVPSARQIVSSYGVAIGTASKALKALHAEGLTEVLPSVGTVVRSKALYRSARERTMSTLLTGRIYPEGHYAKIVSAELVDAPEQVALSLDLEANTSVIRRQRTTYNADGQPLSVSVSWFDGALAEIAPMLLERERILEGTARYIETCTGRTRSSREKILLRAGAATHEEARDLQVSEGSPVLRGRNWYWDTEGDVIEYGESAAGEGLESSFEYNVEEEA
jgi:DNA-binding GntR family transcriptional regulator